MNFKLIHFLQLELGFS